MTDTIEIKGRARTLYARQQASGAYELFQIAHIDDSGIQKRRDWGTYPSFEAAIERGKRAANSQYGA